MTLTFRSGQVTFVSGASKASKRGYLRFRLDEDVKAPAVAVGGRRRAGPAAAGIDARRQVGEDARAADPRVELPRDGQQGVAHGLGFEPAAGHPG